MSTFETIDLTFDPPVARLTLDRPEKLNAITATMTNEVRDALDHIEANQECKVVVVAGAGDSFSTGGDVEELYNQLADTTMYEELRWAEEFVETWHRLWTIPRVTIARVQGYCIAGGLQIASNCDIVVVAEEACLGQPEVPIGFNPDLAYWPLTIGPRKTKELLLTADVVSGAEAAELGMVNTAVPASDLDTEIADLVERIDQIDLEPLVYAKFAVNAALEDSMRQVVRAGSYYNALSHKSGTTERFHELLTREGQEVAIEQVLPDWSR